MMESGHSGQGSESTVVGACCVVISREMKYQNIK